METKSTEITVSEKKRNFDLKADTVFQDQYELRTKYYKIKIFRIARIHNSLNILLRVYIHNYLCISTCLFCLCSTAVIKFYEEQKEFQRPRADYWLVQVFNLG